MSTTLPYCTHGCVQDFLELCDLFTILRPDIAAFIPVVALSRQLLLVIPSLANVTFTNDSAQTSSHMPTLKKRTPPLHSNHLGTSDYKVPGPSRRSSPDSPRRTGATLDPLESKARGGGASEWLSTPVDGDGAGAYDVDMFKVAAFAVRATGIREEAESKGSMSGRHSEGENDGDKKVRLSSVHMIRSSL